METGNMEVTASDLDVPNTAEGEAVAETSATPSAEDMAAHDYKILLPKFYKLLEPMSRRQQQRVVAAVMEYPLETQEPRFSYPEERKAFFLGMQILDCKFVLMNAVVALSKNKEAVVQLQNELEQMSKKEKADGEQ